MKKVLSQRRRCDAYCSR